MYYKYEMHSHTNGCSACGYSSAEEMVDAAVSKGLSGMVFTNHFYHGNSCVDRGLPPVEFIRAYVDDYLKAKKHAEGKDFDVLFGLEEAYRQGKEVLIYGVEPEAFLSTPSFLTMSLTEMRDFVRANNGIIAAAHPFRHRDYIPDPDVFDGEEFFDAIEIYNAQNLPPDNIQAEEYFKNSELKFISGSDIHGGDDFGRAGIAVTERIRETAQMAQVIGSGNYRLIIDGEIR